MRSVRVFPKDVASECGSLLADHCACLKPASQAKIARATRKEKHRLGTVSQTGRSTRAVLWEAFGGMIQSESIADRKLGGTRVVREERLLLREH